MKYQMVVIGVSGEVYRSEPESLTAKELEANSIFFKENLGKTFTLRFFVGDDIITFNTNNIESVTLAKVED